MSETVAVDTDAGADTQGIPAISAYQEFQVAYDFFNERLFDGELPNMLITFQRNNRTFGYFSPDRFDGASKVSELAMNPEFFFSRPLADTLSTLVHEMVHVWQHYAPVKKSRGGYHCKIWADKMESVGLMPSTTGKPGGKRTGQAVTHYIIPDGPFQQAVFELVKSGFALSWYDVAGVSRIVLSGTDTETLEGWAVQAGGDEELVERLTKTMGLEEAPKRTDPQAVEAMRAAVVAAKAVKKSGTRSKYTCGGCRMNAWAKGGASLICGTCNVHLTEHGQGQQPSQAGEDDNAEGED